MKDRFIQYFNSTILQQSFLTTTATFINGTLGMIFYILLIRLLEPSDFGIFSFAVVSLIMISDIASLGTDTGLIRFIGRSINLENTLVLKYLKLTLELRILSAVIIGIVGFFLAHFIANQILHKPEFALPLQLVAVGIGGSLLFTFITASLQALQKYWSWSIISILLNFFRIVFVLGIFYVSSIDVISSLIIYIVLPFIGFLAGMLFLPKFLNVKNEESIAKDFFHYNKWVAMVILFSAISSRLDTFLIGKLLSNYDLGIYSAANQLVSVIPQLVMAVAVVVAPKLSGFDTAQKAISFLKKLQVFVGTICIVGLLLSPFFYYLIPLIFGDAYLASRSIFLILFFAQLVFLFSLPIHQSVFYYFGRPQLFIWTSLIHILIIGLGGWFFIYNYGVMGASIIVLIGAISNFIIPTIWVMNEFRKQLLERKQ